MSLSIEDMKLLGEAMMAWSLITDADWDRFFLQNNNDHADADADCLVEQLEAEHRGLC
jgi:hypothetical protein